MRTYILRRIVQTLPVLLGVATVVFLALRLIPGDPAIALAGEKASAEQDEHLREELGLNRPLPVQYVEFLSRTATLQLGRSIRTGGNITNELVTNFAPTIELSTWEPCGPFGVARRRPSRRSRWLRASSCSRRRPLISRERRFRSMERSLSEDTRRP